jgi:hypothetical protein
MADFRLGRLKFNWRGSWASSTAYVIDDIISFKGNTYVCVVNHTSASSQTAWASTDLDIATPRWQLHVPGVRIMGEWTPNTFYSKNDLISYGANQYLCVTNHTSPANQSSFYTNDFPSWSLYTSGITYKGDWSPGTWYKLNDTVKYGNTLYITAIAHTSGISFDLTKFNIYLESIKFEDSWSGATEYQPGDIVTFGGYTYIAKTIHSNKQPNIYNVNIGETPADWNILTTGFDVKGEYNNSAVYVPGDVVTFGGNTYVKIATGAAGVYPTDTAAWDQVARGLNWRGPWSASATYQVNDVVSKSSASWVNLTAHNTNIDPVADGGANWEALAQGESTLTLQDPGDILYRNGAGANVNLPIGTQGQILSVSETGLPAWERNNSCANVFYVATDGVDSASYGKNISKPWSTLRYALSQLPVGNTHNGNTIFVKSGTYAEQLPLIVPPYTSIIGDDLRSTIIKPLAPGEAYTTPLVVTLVDANTFTVNSGPSTYTGAHTFVSAITDGITRGTGSASVVSGTITASDATYNPSSGLVTITSTAHGLVSGNTALFAPDCLTFKCARDNYTANHSYPSSTGMSLDSVPVENRFSTMFYVSESTTLKDLVMVGMEGFQPVTGLDASDITQATIRGVFLRLNPDVPIIGKSPYITQCSAFSGRPLNSAPNCTGGVGALVDRSIYGATTSNGSMLFDSFTQFHDLGVGFWCKDLGNAEVVSCFTYYAHIGYACSGGGRIRSLAGNNSWGNFGAVSSGFDTTETPITGTVRGQRLNFNYSENSALFKQGEQVAQSTLGEGDYALALILYVQEDYLLIEPITGTFENSKPISGVGSALVVASDAEGTTAAGGATPALEGVKGKIFPISNLPVVGGQAVLPQLNGATKFLNVSGASQYTDGGYYVIKEVVDASTATNIFISALRQFDAPGTAPDSVAISSLSRTSDVATCVTSSAHGLTSGQKVNVVISSGQASARTFATGCDTNDFNVTKGIIGGVLQRSTVTVIDGTTFTYPSIGDNATIAAGNTALNDSVVIKQGTTGGSTKQLHAGGASVNIYNVSPITIRIDNAGTTGPISDSATGITFSDDNSNFLSALSGGADNFIMLNNEILNIVSISGGTVTVTRGQEGTTAASHPDGTVAYYLTKQTGVTTLRGDVDTAVTDVPLFSISGFDVNDIVKINDEFFRVTSVNTPLVGRATLIFAQPKSVNANNGQGIEVRQRYSQVRMTGHDFLQIGTGSRANTNWPNTPLTPSIQSNEIVESFPGRCYYVSTDQDGNFRVGEFFLVEQATGSATLDATAFNLSGLSSLRLGTLGAELGVAINEFSSDPALGSDFSRDSAVPTQLAVKTYVDSQTGSGVSRVTPIVGVAQLTSNGTTATVTSFVVNNVLVGDTIVVTGATQGNYNGEFVVTAIDVSSKTFAYTMPGTAASPATGAISVERKQRIATDLNIQGIVGIRPTWNTGSSTEALIIDAIDTQSGAGTTLINAKVGGSSKFNVDKDGNITAAGNLTVAGSTTTINSTNLSISDTEIIVANGATTAAQANGAGLQLGTSNISFKYDDGNNRWNLLNAGLNIGNSLLISGTEVLSSTTLASSVTSATGLTSIGTLTGLTVNGLSQLKSLGEQFDLRVANATGNQTYDFANQGIYFHPGLGGDVTVALTNVPTPDGKAYSIAIVVEQGATAYKIANSIGINGTSYTIKWSNNNQPTGAENKTDIWSLSIVKSAGTYTVYGSASSFG